MTRATKFWLIPVFLLQLLFFSFLSQHRFVDSDEGFYLLASRLVLMHQKPYIDFFFQQAPLLPYIYALWLKFFHVSWIVARVLPALLTSAIGTLLSAHIHQQTRSWLAAFSSILIFSSSTLIFAWFLVAKPYSLAAFFLLIAYISVAVHLGSSWYLACGGLALGLASDTRSYLALTILIFLCWIFRNSVKSSRTRSISAFLSGFAVGVAPSIYFLALSPSVFLFNNLGYHAIRSDAGLIGMWGQKFIIILMLLLGGPEGNGIQNAILLVISLGFIFSVPKTDWPPKLAFRIGCAIAVISLLPTPVLPQYFCLCVPFLIISTICIVSNLFSNLADRRTRLLVEACYLLIIVIYFAASIGDFRKYFVTGSGIPTVRWAANKDDWTLKSVMTVSHVIDQIGTPGEQVGSFWPGYIFQTHVLPFPGLETDCGILIAGKLTPEQLADYHIASWPQLRAGFERHTPRIVVTANHFNHDSPLVPEVMGEIAKAVLVSSGYNESRSIGDTSIYVCCSARSGEPRE